MMEIKSNNPHPFFQVYSVIQEGLSKPKIIKGEQKPIYWLKDIVLKTKSFLKPGLQFFFRHNKDNSTNNRKPLGEVVGRLTKNIKGKINQLVIGYFPDKEAVKDLDICSIESDVFLSEVKGKNFDIARGIKYLTAIALDKSEFEKPGFKGAVRLATLQCFENDILDKDIKTQGDKKMTYEEFLSANFDWFKRAVKDKQIFPSQLGFTEDDLRKDNNFSEHFKKYDTFEDENKKLQKNWEDEKEARKQDVLNNQKLNAKSRLEKFIPETLTDKQKKFTLKTFDPDKLEDLSDEGLKKHIESSKNEFKKYAEVFGVDDNDLNSNDDNLDSINDDKKFVVNNDKKIEDEIVKDFLEEE